MSKLEIEKVLRSTKQLFSGSFSTAFVHDCKCTDIFDSLIYARYVG